MDPREHRQFSLKLSAPGKIILFGEYSVVFNKPAVAGTLCLRTNLRLVESSGDGTVHLKFSALDLDRTFSLTDIRELVNIGPLGDWKEYLQSLQDSVMILCEKTGKPSSLTSSQMNSLLAFFHSFKKCLSYSHGFSITIDSDLAIGSGIGSSASFSVVMAAASFLYECHLSRHENIDNIIERNGNGVSVVGENWRNEISDTAYSCEKIFHGSPSGVDNNTVLQGSMLEFVKSNNGSSKMRSIVTRPIRVLLVNTNVQRSTKALVENVRQLLKNHPEIIECVLNAMENIARKAVTVLNNSDRMGEMEAQFGELITLNHNLLRVLGVSHPSLENIVSIANKYKLNAKLTGAGGGGFAFVYLPSWVDKSIIKSVETELTAAGYSVSEVSLGGPGLTIDEMSH